jgi:hypothetical protein
MTRNCILNFLGLHHLLAGELATAEPLIDEGRLIADATGNLPVTYAAMLLTAWQGRMHEASELIQAAVQMATGSGRGMLAGFSAYASAVLDSGLGLYNAVRDGAKPAFERDHLGFDRLMVELAEATARTGDVALVQARWTSCLNVPGDPDRVGAGDRGPGRRRAGRPGGPGRPGGQRQPVQSGDRRWRPAATAAPRPTGHPDSRTYPLATCAVPLVEASAALPARR